ncbi:MAG TPA: hypothetical protein PKU81_01055 [Bacteroidales bacterium]|nr:hypothetical protein [Bacteroidales bacterium]
MKKFILLLLALILLSQSINAQNIGISDVAITPDASAMLEVKASNKGLLIPRVALSSTTDNTTIASPATSLLVYNTATAGTAPNNVTPGYYYWTGSKWMRLLAIDDKPAWLLNGNAGTTPGTNFIGTTDNADLSFKTNNKENMRLYSTGQLVISDAATIPSAESNTILTVKPTTNNYRNGISIPMSGATSNAYAINVNSASANSRGYFYENTSTSTSNVFYGAGAQLSTTNIVSGYLGYRNSSGLSYGIYGINGTNDNYATNTNAWAAFIQGRAVISGESSPTSPLGVDLEIRNTTTGTGNPATLSMRQTTQESVSGKILARLNFGDNYTTDPQAQIQVLRDAAASSASDMPTAITFSTIADGSSALTERMRIANNGNVGIGDASPVSLLTVGDGDKFQVNSSGNLVKINNVTYSWPSSQGGASTFLQNNGSGTLSWATFSETDPTAWKITGNNNTDETHFLGTTDAQPLVIRTNNTERSRILSNGQVLINRTTASYAVDLLEVQGNSTYPFAINGLTDQASGVGVYGYNSASGGISIFGETSNGIGVYGMATSGVGVYAIDSSAVNFSIWGKNKHANGTGIVGAGNNQTASYLTDGSGGAFTGSNTGSYGIAINAKGTGVIGVGNNQTANVLTNGSGGAFTGSRVGSYNTFNANTTGSGYNLPGGAGVYADGPNTDFGTETQAYRYGVYGLFPDANSNSCRSAGVLGYFNDSNMGALAYVNSSGIVYGLLYLGGAVDASKSLSNSYTRPSTQVTGIGAGGWGGVLGSFTRGAVMGSIFTAPDFATYNLGNEYTSGLQANIHTLDEKRIATYSITSQDVKIYADGIGKLINGTCKIQFSDDFINLISDESMPIVTVTPLGPSKGLYIAKISSDGFVVVENDGGKSNIDFTWIAIGVQKGYEQAPTLPESVARIDFDEKMMKVMAPENSNEESLPLWYDGQKIRFDNHPIIYSNHPESIMQKVQKSEPTLNKSLNINDKINIH